MLSERSHNKEVGDMGFEFQSTVEPITLYLEYIMVAPTFVSSPLISMKTSSILADGIDRQIWHSALSSPCCIQCPAQREP